MGKADDNKRDKRERIEVAARELFVRHGYAATTMDDVAAHAGVSKGALYFHAGSKAALLNLVFGSDFRAWIDQAFAGARRRRGTVERRLVATYARLMELMCAQPELTRVYMADAGAGQGSGPATDAMHHLLGLTAELLDDAKAAGALATSVDSRDLAYNLWALYFVEQHRWLLDPAAHGGRTRMEQRLRLSFHTQLAGYLVAPDTAPADRR